MKFDFQIVIDQPEKFTFAVKTKVNTQAILRPLKADDEAKLTSFLISLSAATRNFYTLSSYDDLKAREFCAAINKYDKLRFVVAEKTNDMIIGLLEFSFSIVQEDFYRFNSYGITLYERTDCRMGICITDKFQSVGLGTSLIPSIIQIAEVFQQSRIILLGGVLAENTHAIQFYQKVGFKFVGNFQHKEGQRINDMIMNMRWNHFA